MFPHQEQVVKYRRVDLRFGELGTSCVTPTTGYTLIIYTPITYSIHTYNILYTHI